MLTEPRRGLGARRREKQVESILGPPRGDPPASGLGILDGSEHVAGRVRAPLLGERPGAGLDVVSPDLAPDLGAPVLEVPIDGGGPPDEEVRDVVGVVKVLRIGALDAVAELLEQRRRVLRRGDTLRMRLELAATAAR